ncbi:uncharacterized protein METZ01_LOCUS39504 [marine metagenome]|uniref:Uncharacterized protein n=1 Tax=marine metagenome TaxID=408172 RepID=A0A381R563_9ZZZZ
MVSIKSGIGSYIVLIIINYIIFLISDWSIMEEMIPSFSMEFATISIFLILIMTLTDYFFYKGKY